VLEDVGHASAVVRACLERDAEGVVGIGRRLEMQVVGAGLEVCQADERQVARWYLLLLDDAVAVELEAFMERCGIDGGRGRGRGSACSMGNASKASERGGYGIG